MIFEISLLTATFAVLIYMYLTWNYNYWKKQKIPFSEPQLFYGNIKDVVLMKNNKAIVLRDLYKTCDEPAMGLYNMRTPQWLVRDPVLVRMITTNEFSNFRENDIYSEPSDFFFSTNVFFFSGEEWKKKRGIITLALTMSKLKLFIPYMVDICREMLRYVEENADKDLDAKDFSGLYTIETAMSYTYGVKCNAYKDPHSKYREVFDEIFKPNWWNGLKITVATLCPSIGHFFKIGFTTKNFQEFYLNVVKETVDYKKKNNLQRKDFLQFLIDAGGKDGVPEMSVPDMAGLTMNIAADATETTSAGLTSVFDALIRNQDKQQILFEEIDSRIKSLDDIVYENIIGMPYLQAFISESLRIYPPVGALEKKCTNACTLSFNGRKYKFHKDDSIAIPIYALHWDSKHFPEPNVFKPERFLGSDGDPLAYMPFGSGPRMCLGRTFAHIQMKVFLCALLKYYQVLPKNNPPPPLEFDPLSPIFLMAKGGVNIRLRKR